MSDRAIDDRQAYPARRRRRYGLLAAVVGVLLAFGYWLSPYVAVARFALAAQAGDTPAVMSRMDLNAVRNGFARQIVRAYLARNPQTRGLDPFSRQAVGSVAAGYVSGIVAEYLTPEVIADLLQHGRSRSRAGELLGEASPLPRLDGIGQAWSLFLASGFSSPRRFMVEPGNVGGAAGYRLTFGLGGTGWLLRLVELPDTSLSRLVDMLSTRIERRS